MDGVILRLKRIFCPLSLLFLALALFMIAHTKPHRPYEALTAKTGGYVVEIQQPGPKSISRQI